MSHHSDQARFFKYLASSIEYAHNIMGKVGYIWNQSDRSRTLHIFHLRALYDQYLAARDTPGIMDWTWREAGEE